MAIRPLMFVFALALWPGLLPAQDELVESDEDRVTESPEGEETGIYRDGEELTEQQVDAITTDTTTNEDPDALRRAERETEERPDRKTFSWDWYGSVRVHAINAFIVETGESERNFGDGASRLGITADWQMTENWNIFGRIESGFDVLDTFTSKAQNEDGGIFTPRLYNVSLESDWLYAKLGKSWSVYYQVAGAADRFSIFGGNAAGVYNAGTDGGDTGTGRANDALQTRVFIDIEKWTTLRPGNVNLQFQQGQSIPGVEGKEYGNAWSASAWQETDFGVGVGVAYHRAIIDDPMDPVIREAGIDGDARALAVALKTSGDRWFVSFVWTSLDNIEATNEGKYFQGRGMELFGQWQFRDDWWLVGGGNWLDPDDEQPQVGDYEIRYMVLGLRYTWDGFKRMFYAEWRNDYGTLVDGTPNKNEFTVGVRWDFGY